MKMKNAIWLISYELEKGTSEEEFLVASKRCHDEVLSKQKGFISWDVLRDGDTWIDFVKWETAEDAKNGETAGAGDPASNAFYGFMNMNTCTLKLYTVEKSH